MSRHGYNPEAVNQAIAASNRAGRRIGGREARMIHALLKGREAPAPAITERERQILELGAKAPLQSKGRPVEDAGHLPLFIAADEPTLF